MNNASRPCTKTTCPYCGVGCGIDAKFNVEKKLEVSGSEEHTANLGRLCVKGNALPDTISTTNRLLYPEVRGNRVEWDEALAKVAEGFNSIISEHGPDSVAFYLSGQLLTEDYYVANKLMKGFIGSPNVDTNSRLCMASAVASYKRALGADVMPCNYADLELCDLLIFVGSNAAWTHPVLYQRISAAKKARPNMQVVVIDPRETATCEIADIHLQLEPGSDAFLFSGLIRYLEKDDSLNESFIDQHCEGLAETLAAAAHCEIDVVADKTGVDEEQLLKFYEVFASTEKVVSFYSQGVNQSATGTDKCNAIINCHLLTGRIGKPGMGPFSITGQPNAMGGREVGGLANQLAAHMDYTPETVERVGRFWQAKNMATEPGFKAVDLFNEIAKGKIKAVWIMATNPVVSLPQSARVREALDACELVVVSDCVRNTDTNAYADVLLPATGWSEKDGTVTNSERTISRQRRLFPATADSRHDWQIIRDVARLMGFSAAFDYRTARDIFVEHAALSEFENGGERAFNIGKLKNLSQDEYDSLQPLQWPVTEASPNGTPRLFSDYKFYTDTGRAKLIPIEALLPTVTKSEEFPFLLNTGRLRDQWHTMTRTGLAPKLLAHFDSPFAQLNPTCCAELGVEPGDLVEVSSVNGRLLVPIQFSEGVRRGEVFVPIHWNRQFANKAGVSELISPRVDPISGQPESKLEAVAVKPIVMQRWVSFASTHEISMHQFDYWHKVPLQNGYRYLAGMMSDNPKVWELQSWLKKEFPHTHKIEFSDEEQQNFRIACFLEDKICAEIFLAQSLQSLPPPNWLGKNLGEAQHPHNLQMLASDETDPEDTGKLICSCFEVGENQIINAIQSGCTDASQLGVWLQCGTKCGSCIPELTQLVKFHKTVAIEQVVELENPSPLPENANN
ncbi:MAG: molybdopterin-dependent oxidoreductase [Robiginitomaculum sp.]|nr:molybdopterin-dependent oxidoreductase [Robiginitomaculum sp.]